MWIADAYDSALMECVIGLFKTECIRATVFHAGPYRSIGDVEYATAGWVDWSRQPTPAQHPWDDDPRGVRASPLRDSQQRGLLH